jgi:hypothetical protein
MHRRHVPAGPLLPTTQSVAAHNEQRAGGRAGADKGHNIGGTAAGGRRSGLDPAKDTGLATDDYGPDE